MQSIEIVKAFGNESATTPLKQIEIKRRICTPNDVKIEIKYCGVCHSDVHTARSEWGPTIYPCIPGHEIVGNVIEVGEKVTKYKIGDTVGVGVMVDSCRKCEYCQEGEEQYCENGMTVTYGAPDKFIEGEHTHGGYSEIIVVDEDYVLKISNDVNLAETAPLLCAGITTYSPLKRWNIKKGQKVGIVGIGGLGHIAIKIAKAMDAYVVAFTTSESKFNEAKRLGADDVIFSKDENQMKKYYGKLHYILDAVAAKHDINNYLGQLKVNGALVLVGAPVEQLSVAPFSLIPGRKSFGGSLIGGIKETQEMLDFCAKHNITADIELIDIKNINTAFDRIVDGDVKYRFVIDMKSLHS